MNLIIKISSICNFKCSFCSSSKLSSDDSDYLDIQYVFDFLHRFPNTSTIIVNGGEPILKQHLSFYEKLIDFLDMHKYKASLAITSNLWDFYKNPERWVELFKNPRVGITTSFQFDDSNKPHTGRLKPDFTQYTESDFWKVSDLFLEKIGYRPDFISVIDETNSHLAIKNVELAKKMSDNVPPTGFSSEKKLGVECKLNYVMKSGPIKTYVKSDGTVIKQGAAESLFVMGEIYKIHVDIWKKNLFHWDHSTKEMMKVLKDYGKSTICPLNRDCDSGIRVLNPTSNKKNKSSTIINRYFSCPAFSDKLDSIASIDFNREVKEQEFFTPLQKAENLNSLKKSCYFCPLFNICNGCRSTISDFKQKGGAIIEKHCKIMKSLAPDILKSNGFSDLEISKMISPYKQENF